MIFRTCISYCGWVFFFHFHRTLVDDVPKIIQIDYFCVVGLMDCFGYGNAVDYFDERACQRDEHLINNTYFTYFYTVRAICVTLGCLWLWWCSNSHLV